MEQDQCFLHVLGMLDRDQRTVKTATYRNRQDRSTSSAPIFSGGTHDGESRPQRKPSSFSRRFWRTRLRDTLHRFKQFLVIGTYLLCIVSVPRTLSAPAGPPSVSAMAEERWSSHPKWINPCGVKKEDLQGDSFADIPPVSTMDLLSQIISQSNIALAHANKFREEYTEKVHNMDSISLNDLWQMHRFAWLPEIPNDIPKVLGERLPDDSDHLRSLEFDSALVNIYHELQKIAVGLEAVAWDQQDDNGLFKKNFTETGNFLRSLLCEIQMAIIERGLEQKPDVQRDHMAEENRQQKGATARDVRDWIIYRDYINALEYTVQAFRYLKEKEANKS